MFVVLSIRVSKAPRHRSHILCHRGGDARERRVGAREDAGGHRGHRVCYRDFLQEFARVRLFQHPALHDAEHVAMREQSNDGVVGIALDHRLRRRQASRREQPLDRPTWQTERRGGEPVGAGEFGERSGVTQRMTLARADNNFVPIQRAKSERGVELGDGPQADHEIERFVPHRGQQQVRQSLDDAYARARKLLAEACDCLGSDQGDAGRPNAESNRTLARPAELPRLFLGLAQFRVGDAGAREKGAPRGRSHNTACVASEKLHMQLGLQAADALRDGGLRNAELACSGADAAALSDSEKVTDLGEPHSDSSLAISIKPRPSYAVGAPRALLPVMKTRLCSLIAGAMLAVHVVAHSHASNAYPTKPIRLIVSGAPGSPPDALARIISEPLAALGQPVMVEDRPGGVGTLAMGAVAKAAPDGHTLGIIGLSQMVAPSLVPQMSYDIARDLAPVTQLVWTATILVIRPSSPLTTVADFVALAKAKPSALTYASAGNGTPSHLASELFKHHAGIEVQHVPYKGMPAGLAAVMGEQVDIAFAGIATALPLIKSGKLRALGTAGARHLPAFPDLPTIAELGFAGYHLNEWYGVVAPAGTPPEVIAKLASEMVRVVALPETKARLAHLGLYQAENPGPEALGALIRAELPRWKQIVREASIHVD